jgi:hypothetical protein
LSETLRLWSVTTLLKLGLGTSDALVNWAVNTTAEAAFDRFKILSQFVEDGDREGAVKWLKDQRWQKSGKAAARGTDVHKAAEAFALGQTPEVEDHILPYVEQYRRFLDEHSPEFLLSEAPVYAPNRGGYAGTLDAIMRLDGKTVVADLKTTPHGPDSGRSRPPFEESALQLVAYRNAELVGLLSEQRYSGGKRYYVFDEKGRHELLPETDGAVVITVSPFDYVVTPVKTDEEVWRAFRHVVECARWRVETSRNVFGPPISARQQVAA